METSASSQKLECAGKSSSVCNYASESVNALSEHGLTHRLAQETVCFVSVGLVVARPGLATELDAPLERPSDERLGRVPGAIFCDIRVQQVARNMQKVRCTVQRTTPMDSPSALTPHEECNALQCSRHYCTHVRGPIVAAAPTILSPSRHPP